MVIVTTHLPEGTRENFIHEDATHWFAQDGILDIRDGENQVAMYPLPLVLRVVAKAREAVLA